MIKYWDIIKTSYEGYARYLWQEITFQYDYKPWWQNYFWALILISIFFFVWEWLKPWNRKQPKFRKHFWLDVFYMFFNFFLFSLIAFNALSDVFVRLFSDFLGLFGLTNVVAVYVGQWPIVLQLFLLFVVRDFIQWWVHRLLHWVPWFYYDFPIQDFLKTGFMKKNFSLIITLLFCLSLNAQEDTYQTFKDRWVINSPSVETLPKRKLDIRIAHRFGDMGGDAGGWPTFYGLETAADVSFGFEAGLSDRLTFGFNRSKGAGSLRQLLNGYLKYKFMAQTEGGKPFSMALMGLASLSTSEKSDDPSSMTYFDNFAHRMVHNGTLIIARKFSNKFALQVSGGVTHRNVVPTGEDNNTVHIGMATRIQVTRSLGIIGDFAMPFIEDSEESSLSHYAPIGIGFEFDTGGHVFQLNLTNANGLMPTDYIPYTYSNWGDGQFRLGFTISRMFNL